MPSPEQLSQRIGAEFQAARRRIEELQERAAQEAESIGDRYERFEELRARICDEILPPRIESLVQHFENVEQIPHRHRLGGDLVLSFAHTPECPAKVELKLSVTHDERIEHLIVTYDLKILPVFIKFDPHATLEFPLEQVDEQQLESWLDDRLVAFVQTYLSMQFVDQYQRENMVSDPVASIRFPKSFAKTTSQYKGHTYYFLSEESKEEFEKDPTLFVVTAE
jgi:YHS domain-containing protein